MVGTSKFYFLLKVLGSSLFICKKKDNKDDYYERHSTFLSAVFPANWFLFVKMEKSPV
jgi:hypothetical protein